MSLSSFNFAQPLWLWGVLLIPSIILIKRFWNRRISQQNLSNAIDKELLPHIIISNSGHDAAYPGWLYAIMAALIFIALANPRWDFKEFNAYQPAASVVVLFDLSDPKNVSAGRQQIEDLLNNSQGIKLGLVAYAGMAHIVTPITDDLGTLRNYLPALDNDIITRQGSNLHAAIQLGAKLLETEPGENKSILVVSGSEVKKISMPKNINYSVYVLGVGEQNQQSLQNFAKNAKGYYIKADHSEKAVNAILHKIQINNSSQENITGKFVQWDDKYYWFLIPAAFIFLYVFRFGALCLCLFILVTPQVEALDCFKNSDQQALQAYKNAEFKVAADNFTNFYNKAVALYRAGEYEMAENLFNEDKSIDSKYNMGNAQMQQEKWREAINSYEQVLQDAPDHEDAKYNLEIARKKLEESKSQDDKKEQSQKPEQNKQQKDRDNQENPESSQQQKSDDDQKNRPQDSDNEENGSSEQNMPSESKSSSAEQQQEQSSSDQVDQDDAVTSDEIKELSTAQSSQSDMTKNMDDMDLWLNRIDSDIKFLLRNKFYIEGVINGQ